MARRYYTTHEASHFLGVSLPTVVNWIKASRLKAHRTPGGHRRIAHEELVGFIRRHNMPMPPELEAESPTSKVLVIDDDPIAREVLTTLLEKNGISVKCVDNGFAAGRAVEQFKPEIVLLDLMMPGVDGFRVLKELHADEATRHLPVVAVTGRKDDETLKRIASEPFAGLIPKPFDFAQVLKQIDEALKAARRAA